MLRYFYLIICIQMCFCSVYEDNDVDYDTVSRQVRSKTTRGLKRVTKSLRSRVVQFDVQNFLQGPVEVADDYRLYGYMDKNRKNRHSSNDVGHAEVHDSPNERNRQADYSPNVGNVHVNARSQHKMVNPRHYNFNSLDTRDRTERGDQKKAAGHGHSKAKEERTFVNSERKCSFRNMRIPFFSRNKATAKAKRHKKRRIFCFNCKKTTTAAVRHITTTKVTENTEPKPDDTPKENQNPPTFDKTNDGIKINKRAYGQLCPKCIRELLVNLKKKTTTTKKVKHQTQKAKANRVTKQKTNLEDTFQDEPMSVGNERMKRNEVEEQERERRLKELEEVERKIADVHITTPYFRGNISNK